MKKLLIIVPLLFLLAACGTVSGNISGAVHTLIVQPDDGRTAVVDAINSAQSSITLTIYTLSDPTIEAALKAAQANNAQVKILYNYYSFPFSKKESVLRAMASLEAAGILTKAASPDFTVTHQKTFTMDGAKSIIVTFNLEESYFGGTRDFGILTNYPDEISEIARVFSADWDYSAVTPSLASLVWSNVNSRAKLLETIRGATRTLDIYNEELADWECLNALTAEAAAGVTVRVISAQLGGSGEADGNKANREYLNAHGVQAKYMPTATYLYCHAKMILADQGTSGAKAFIGSENFSPTSLDNNRELGILLNESDILTRLHNTFETDWPLCAFD